MNHNFLWITNFLWNNFKPTSLNYMPIGFGKLSLILSFSLYCVFILSEKQWMDFFFLLIIFPWFIVIFLLFVSFMVYCYRIQLVPWSLFRMWFYKGQSSFLPYHDVGYTIYLLRLIDDFLHFLDLIFSLSFVLPRPRNSYDGKKKYVLFKLRSYEGELFYNPSINQWCWLRPHLTWITCSLIFLQK